MGHSFGVYRELIHVPLVMRLPGQNVGQRIGEPISTTRLFHTVLDAAGISTYETHYGHNVRSSEKSLLTRGAEAQWKDGAIVSEAYAPEFALTAVEKHKPELLDPLACRATHWAVVQEAYKLIHVEDTRSELYHWADDPLEKRALQDAHDTNGTQQQLLDQLDCFLERARQHSPRDRRAPKADLDDEHVRQRLRGLGYIE
jgi:arylsulfatase A-like enzyme